MWRNMLETIGGRPILGTPFVGLLTEQILAETAAGTNGTGLLNNDGLVAGQRYRLVLQGAFGADGVVYENGSFRVTAPASVSYLLYENNLLVSSTPTPASVGSIAVLTAAVAGQAAFTVSIAATGAVMATASLTAAVAGQAGFTVTVSATGAVAASVIGVGVAAGRYCNQLNLQDRYGLDELVQITNPTNPDATAVDTVRTADAIDDIDALIDAKLAARYALPLASVPRVLRNIACDVVRARLYEDRITDHVSKRETAALRLLDDIAAGKVSLGLADNGQTTAPTDGPQFVTSGRVFTPASLADYAP